MRRLGRVWRAEGAAGVVGMALVVVALVPLVGVELGPVDRLDVLPERRRVGVALGAAGSLAGVGFLRRKSGSRYRSATSSNLPSLAMIWVGFST